MVLEVALLQVKVGLEGEFEVAFRKASAIISSMPGYGGHQLQKCIEAPAKYLLLVNWDSLEDHTVGFRGSDKYQQWRELLHHFYDPFPTVEHFEEVQLEPAGRIASLGSRRANQRADTKPANP